MATTCIFFALAIASNAVLATPIQARSEYAVKDSHFVPSAWSRVDRAPSEHMLGLNIGLRQSNFAELERHLYEVSDPGHHRYGKHLTQAEVEELVKPASDTWYFVHEWLSEAGIEAHRLAYSPAKDWIKIYLPVSDAERLLDTEYSIFEHEEGDRLVRTTEWSIPKHLHEHIETVAPTNSFFRNSPQSVGMKPVSGTTETVDLKVAADAATATNPCNIDYVTPDCLRTFYGTYNYTARAVKKNSVALCDYLGESNNRSDTRLFLKAFRPEAAAYADKFIVEVINDGNDEQTQETPAELNNGKDLEGNLDVETIIGITYPTHLTAYTTGGSPPFHPDLYTPTDTNEPYLAWLHFILSQSDLPYVVSTSYADEERTVPLSYARSVCKGFAQLGARGVSLFFGSGDNGVGPNGTCFTNDGTDKRQFSPYFPASCPYVTSVGATKNFNPEVAAYDAFNGFASGGGFSNYFPAPAYQSATVQAYIKTLGSRFKGLYNNTGRGYPDLAAQGQRFITVWNGTGVLLDGTSASTPTTASIFALVNDALLSAGRAPLGFLNPWLYSSGYAALNDITDGSAIGCDGAGFPAQAGWDAVTGFGTPDFPSILKNLNLSFT